MQAIFRKLVSFYLSRLMHFITSVAIVQMTLQWISTDERIYFELIQEAWVTSILFCSFLIELLLRTLFSPDWSGLKGLRTTGKFGKVRVYSREIRVILKTQVFNRWYLFDLLALLSFVRFDHLRLLRGLRTIRAFTRWLRLTRVVKQFRPMVRKGFGWTPGLPYMLLIYGNIAIIIGSALIVAGMEGCSFGKALTWTVQVFATGGSFWTELTNPRAQAFGDWVKIPGILFYTSLVGLLPDMFNRSKRFFRKTMGLRNHFVIIGWSEHAQTLLRNLLRREPGLQQRIYIVNDGDMSEDIRELGIQYVRGAITNPHTLERVAIQRARAVIIPPARGELANLDERDEQTFLLASYIASHSKKGNASHLLACTEDERMHDTIEALGGTALETLSFGGRLLSQAKLKPGLEQVFRDILHSRTANIYADRVPKRWLKRSFLELCRASENTTVKPLGLMFNGQLILVPKGSDASADMGNYESIVYLSEGDSMINLPLLHSNAKNTPTRTRITLGSIESTSADNRDLLIIGWNAQVPAIIHNLRNLPGHINLLTKSNRFQAEAEACCEDLRISVGATNDPVFLKHWIADDNIGGIFILVDTSDSEGIYETGYKSGEILLRIRELEKGQGIPHRHIVIETSSSADNDRLMYLNNIHSIHETTEPIKKDPANIGLVCPKELCGLLIAQAVDNPAVINVMEDIVNSQVGCDIEVTPLGMLSSEAVFSDISAMAFKNRDLIDGIPIGVMRNGFAFMNPPALFQLNKDDALIHLLRIEQEIATEPQRVANKLM